MCSMEFLVSLNLFCESELLSGERYGAAEDIPGNLPRTLVVYGGPQGNPPRLR